MSVESGVKTWE